MSGNLSADIRDIDADGGIWISSKYYSRFTAKYAAARLRLSATPKFEFGGNNRHRLAVEPIPHGHRLTSCLFAQLTADQPPFDAVVGQSQKLFGRHQARGGSS
jgi:hypothetical protein